MKANCWKVDFWFFGTLVVIGALVIFIVAGSDPANAGAPFMALAAGSFTASLVAVLAAYAVTVLPFRLFYLFKQNVPTNP